MLNVQKRRMKNGKDYNEGKFGAKVHLAPRHKCILQYIFLFWGF